MLNKWSNKINRSIPDDNNIVNISPKENYMGRKGIMLPDVLGFPISHGQVGIWQGKIGPHGSALQLQVEVTIKIKIIVSKAKIGSF